MNKPCLYFTLPLVSTPINWNYTSFNAWNDTLMNNNYKYVLLFKKKGSYQDSSLYATLCSKTFYLDLTQKSTKIIWDTPSWHVLGYKKYIDLLMYILFCRTCCCKCRLFFLIHLDYYSTNFISKYIYTKISTLFL